MTRRDFLGFFLLGGFLSFLGRKLTSPFSKKIDKPREAMFWRRL
jgi:hypothetical protein